MSVYLFTVFIVIFLSGLAQKYDYHKNNGELVSDTVHHSSISAFFLALTAFALIYIAGCRYYVGTDFGYYYKYYLREADGVWNAFIHLKEPGYGAIAKLAIFLGGKGELTIFLASAVTIGLSLLVVFRSTDKVVYAVLLFLFLECWHTSFNAVRQCLAASFVFLGYSSLLKKHFFRYACCVFIAFLFHKSAILMILFYFLCHRKVSFGNVLLLALGAAVITASDEYVFTATTGILERNIGSENSYLNTSVNVFRTLVGIAPAVFFLILYQKKEKTENEVFFLNLLLFHAAVTLATFSSTYYARYTIYSAPFLTIAIPELSKGISKRNRRTISFIILLLYFAFWIYDISISSALNNFHFVWEQ